MQHGLAQTACIGNNKMEKTIAYPYRLACMRELMSFNVLIVLCYQNEKQ